MPADLLSINDVARRLSVSPAAVRRWIVQRRVPVVKLGALTRLRTLDVEELVRQGLPDPGTYPRPKDPRGRARVGEDVTVLSGRARVEHVQVLPVPQSQLDRAG